MKFVMTQSICPEGIEKLKADTNGQVEIIAEDNPDPNNYLDDMTTGMPSSVAFFTSTES